MKNKGMKVETIAVHSGERRPGPEGSVVFPIFQGTIYTVEPGTDYHDIKYIRLNSTPSQIYLHDKLAQLEGAEAALATASGMAALTSAVLSVVKQGDHVLAGEGLYGGTHSFLTQHAADLGFTYTFVDLHRPDTWESARTPRTRLLLCETITNPLMRVPRLREIVAFAKQHALVTLIDNTFASPVNFRPLEHGFDLVVHSATKYLNGHSDLVAGCVMGSADAIQKVRHIVNHFGGSLDPHAGFLLARGMKTLAVRMRAQNENAQTVAEMMASHPAVVSVNFPGLSTHPEHALARELFSGFGGMLSFRPKGGVEAAQRVMERLTIPYLTPSLGGVESLVSRPTVTSHASIEPRERERFGITDDLIRVSCGIEHASDLVEDFRQALSAAS